MVRTRSSRQKILTAQLSEPPLISQTWKNSIRRFQSYGRNTWKFSKNTKGKKKTTKSFWIRKFPSISSPYRKNLSPRTYLRPLWRSYSRFCNNKYQIIQRNMARTAAELTPAEILVVQSLEPIGTALQQIRVNAGGTSLEYFTESSGSGDVV